MHRETAEMCAMLSDPNKTRIHIVAIPEELPMEEAFQLKARLEDEFELPMGNLIINRTPPELESEAVEVLQALENVSIDGKLVPLMKAGELRRARLEHARNFIQSGLRLDPDAIRLPRIFVGKLGRDELEHLADVMVQQESRQ
jgi:anion-transporting  ArsA/GET3 family ATPase